MTQDTYKINKNEKKLIFSFLKNGNWADLIQVKNWKIPKVYWHTTIQKRKEFYDNYDFLNFILDDDYTLLKNKYKYLPKEFIRKYINNLPLKTNKQIKANT